MYTFTSNPGAFPRFATISVPNASVTVSQNGPPAADPRAVRSFGAVRSGETLNPLSPPEDVQLTIDEQPGSAWMVTANRPWIVVTPSTGLVPATLRVSIDPAAAAALAPSVNSYTGEIGITAAFAPATAVRTLLAALTLPASGLTSAPTGVFETPLNNTTGASGANARDRVGDRRHRPRPDPNFRHPVPGEGPSEIFTGDATRVKGARADIAARFGTPQSRRAGWGYMLLSNVLPGAGNGTFTFSGAR